MKSARPGTLLPAIVLGAALAVPTASSAAVQLAGDAFEVQGRFHLSLDIADTDMPNSGTDLGISSNSSMIGFRGRHGLDSQTTLLWQLEQGFRADSGNGNLATRNTFLGVESQRYGALLAGYHDTPFKDVAKRWAVLSYTVADRRVILGSGNGFNNVMNARGKSSILYINKVQGLEYRVMYAADTVDANNGAGPDDNDNRLISAGAWYTLGALELSAGFERWSNLVSGTQSGRATALRLAANHKVGGNAKVGVLFETIDTNTSGADGLAGLDRNAFGFNGSYREGLYTYEAQLMIAGDHRGTGSSGAINIGLGATREINRQFNVYAAFSMTNNDSNANYNAVGGGHGDLVPTDNGGTPYALSAGAVFRF